MWRTGRHVLRRFSELGDFVLRQDFLILDPCPELFEHLVIGLEGPGHRRLLLLWHVLEQFNGEGEKGGAAVETREILFLAHTSQLSRGVAEELALTPSL